MLSAGDGGRSVIGAGPAASVPAGPVAEPVGDRAAPGRRRRCAGWPPSAPGWPAARPWTARRRRRRRCAAARPGVWLIEELARLAVVVGEATPSGPAASGRPRRRRERRGTRRPGPRAGRVGTGPRVRLVVDPPDRVGHRHVAVLLEVGDRALRRVDRDVREVRAAEPLELRVEVGEVAALQQRVVGEVDARARRSACRTRPARSRRRSCRPRGRAPAGRRGGPARAPRG